MAFYSKRTIQLTIILISLLALLVACYEIIPTTPTATPAPDVEVCAAGCDFTTLQAALDADSTDPGAVIVVRDAVHTEVDIQVHKSVTIQGQGAAHGGREPDARADRLLLSARRVDPRARRVRARPPGSGAHARAGSDRG